MANSRDMEIEVKIQLESFADYLKLLGFLGSPDGQTRQLNAFFDDSNRTLKSKGWALRVRVQDDTGLVTLKSAISREGGLSVRREIEGEIDRGLALEIVGGAVDLMAQEVKPIRFAREELALGPVEKLLQFNNERQSKDFRIGDYDYVLEVDKTEFQDGSVDYELEVELERRDQYEVVLESIRRMFLSLGIDFHPQPISKFKRALQKAAMV